MQDLKGVENKKGLILSLINKKGPSLPVHVAREIESEVLFASAFLAELFSEKKLKMSDMKVGNSPLYFMDGQENMLENFIGHLNFREREAFSLLKEKMIMEDEKLEPVVRVALRAIKDFAIPIRIRIGQEVKLFWKYFTILDSDVRDIIQKNLNLINEKKIERESNKTYNENDLNRINNVQEIGSNMMQDNIEDSKLDNRSDNKREIGNKIKRDKNETRKMENIIDRKKEKVSELSQKNKGDLIGEKQFNLGLKEKGKVKKKIEEFPFVKNIKNYFLERDIEFLEIINEKKKDFVARVRIDIIFGKQEFLLVAKDKKRINESDLTLALQKAQNEKMPALFVSPGELSKKGKECLKEWRNLVKFEKIRF